MGFQRLPVRRSSKSSTPTASARAAGQEPRGLPTTVEYFPLLAGMTVLLAPPAQQPIVSLRGLAVLLALLGFLAELAWVVISEII